MIETLKEILQQHKEYWSQILKLSLINQKKNYKGSDLGWFWAIMKPAMYIGIFYFAITIGFKSSKAIDGIVTPYFIWLTAGMIAWFYLRDMILDGASCFRRYKYLVTKIKYPVSTIPTIVSTSDMIIQGILILALVALALVFGCTPSPYWIQLPFYTLMMYLFATVWAMFAGLLSVISRDFYNFLRTINTALFWLSGILFDINSIDSEMVRKAFYFNPITYCVEGYRNAICRDVWFFEEPIKLACFLGILVVFTAVTLLVYKRLKKVLPDVI